MDILLKGERIESKSKESIVFLLFQASKIRMANKFLEL